MKKYPVILLCVLVVFAIIFGFCSSSSSSNQVEGKEIIAEIVTPAYIFTSPHIPEIVEFAGEALPIHFFDVRESLERELLVNMNFHSNTLQYLKRVTRFFPVIEPILAANGIPDDFKYLSLIESDFMNRVSPAGATGFWQFMRATAIDYRLEISSEIDERYHLEKSTVAACQYLKEAYGLYRNWTMVAASYNMGRAGLSSQVSRQKCNNYFDLLLNEETSRYVYRIAAVKLILTDPQRYGFFVPDNEKYQPIPYTEVEITTGVSDFADFAFRHKTNYKMLKLLNPWLRDNKLTNSSRKTYIVKIPAEGFREATQHRID